MEKTCSRCKTGVGRHVPTTKQPSIATLERWMDNDTMKATDGCKVYEMDGKCSHGHSSWMLIVGVI